MPDPKQKAVFLKSLIKKRNPSATTLLELACGTGAVLQYFADDFEIFGLDLSLGMLSVARKRLPKVALFRQDMRKFAIPRSVDTIVCVYDSINHLVKFNDWCKVFARVKQHLNARGVFIFDVNTEHRLKALAESPVWFHRFERNYLAMSVQGKPNGLTNWNVTSVVTQPATPEEGEYVRVMSLHKSKGLTSKALIVAGCIEGLIPYLQQDWTPTELDTNIKEQRRLFYVAITRATDILVISSFATIERKLFHQIGARVRAGYEKQARTISSRFLGELGPWAPHPETGAGWVKRNFE
jgi:superfamily I DNA/RNA helicase